MSNKSYYYQLIKNDPNERLQVFEKWEQETLISINWPYVCIKPFISTNNGKMNANQAASQNSS